MFLSCCLLWATLKIIFSTSIYIPFALFYLVFVSIEFSTVLNAPVGKQANFYSKSKNTFFDDDDNLQKNLHLSILALSSLIEFNWIILFAQYSEKHTQINVCDKWYTLVLRFVFWSVWPVSCLVCLVVAFRRAQTICIADTASTTDNVHFAALPLLCSPVVMVTANLLQKSLVFCFASTL